jgi:hypothetical protein
MIEALAQQIATQLAPVLPYLAAPTALAAKDAAAKAAGGKVGEAAWNKAVNLWSKIRPAVEKEPEVAKALQEVAQKPEDPRTEAILSWQLEKILASMPTKELNEIQGIVNKSRSEVRVITAMNGGIAIGGNATGNIMFTNDRGTKQ